MEQAITITQTKELPEAEFMVHVRGEKETEHRVTVRDEYHHKLTGGDITPEELVRKSFQFLLEREDNTSILPEFDLETIKRYFPEYEDTVVHI